MNRISCPFFLIVACPLILAGVFSTEDTSAQIIQDIASGVEVQGTVQADSLGTTQYRLNVPPGSNSVLISVTPDIYSTDLAFAIRYGAPVTWQGNGYIYDEAVDDYYSGKEEHTYQNPTIGQWYIAIYNWSSSSTGYRLKAEVALSYTSTPTPSQSPTPATTPTATVVSIHEDLDQNGIVDSLDIFKLLRAGRKQLPVSEGDVDGNHRMDYADLFHLARAWQRGTPQPSPSSTQTPWHSPTPTHTPPSQATATFTPPPVEDEATLCKQLFGSSYETTLLGTQAVEIAAEAVWGARDLNGGVWTYQGTLTQTSPDSENWTYSPSPADRLVVAYANGPVLEFIFTRFEGWKQGTWEDFTKSHGLDFTVKIQNQVDIRVQSESAPDAEQKIHWSRRIQGNLKTDTDSQTLDLTHTGSWDGYVEYPDTYDHTIENCSGQIQSSRGTYTISERYEYRYTYDARHYHHIFNRYIWNSSSASFGENTWQYQDAFVRWEMQSVDTYFNVVREPYFWQCRGSLLKNGQVLGTLQFTGEPIRDTHGPDLVLQLTGGGQYFLHTLIQYP